MPGGVRISIETQVSPVVGTVNNKAICRCSPSVQSQRTALTCCRSRGRGTTRRRICSGRRRSALASGSPKTADECCPVPGG